MRHYSQGSTPGIDEFVVVRRELPTVFRGGVRDVSRAADGVDELP